MSEQISRQEFEALKKQVKVNFWVALTAVCIGFGTLSGIVIAGITSS